LLRSDSGNVVSESLHTHLLRSLCPVTNQPDMGSLQLTYRGPRINPASFLQYVVSFREHKDFHEACVERMFIDIMDRCQPQRLSLYARYQRRGGIDINPFRSNIAVEPGNPRLWRQ
jgi:7-cyano-7-deazaguanine reductase